MSRTREKIPEERRRLKTEYGPLFDSVAGLLYKHDPMGINFEVNPDEYEPEAGTILPRLRDCQSEEDALRVVHEEFVRWFSASSAGAEGRYTEIAGEIWQLWQQQRPAASGR